MKPIQPAILIAILSSPLLLHSIAFSASLQSPLVEPTEIRVSGIRDTVVDRLITLTILEGTTEGLSFACTPLVEVEGEAAETAPQVRSSYDSQALKLGQPNEILLHFDLKGLGHGEYRGKLRIQSQTGRLIDVPLTIRVRDNWFTPLSVLLGGVCLGLLITWYRTSGQMIDEVTTGSAALKALAADPAMPEPFQDAIASKVVDVELAVTDQNFEKAGSLIAEGRVIANRWLRRKNDWNQLVAFIAVFRDELTDRYSPKATTVNSVLKALQVAEGKIPEQDDPDTLRASLNQLHAQVERFGQGLDQLNDLDSHRPLASPTFSTAMADRVFAFRGRLLALDPNDDAGWKTLGADIETAQGELDQDIKRAEEARKAVSNELQPPKPREIPLSKDVALAGPLSQVPIRANFGLDSNASAIDSRWARFKSGLRLGLYRWFGYLLPVIVFVYTGMSQYYRANLTFGSFDHYVALFLWGFGADASGAKVQSLINEAAARGNPTGARSPVTSGGLSTPTAGKPSP